MAQELSPVEGEEVEEGEGSADMAPVSINNAFCQSLKLNSTNDFTAYSFDELPRVDPGKVEQFNTSYSTNLIEGNYEYWGFYLLEGSNVVISAVGGSTMYLYIIKGTDNLNTWISKKGDCSGCYLDLGITKPRFVYHLKVTERDTYYFMFYERESIYAVFLDAEVYVQRTLFAVSSATGNCSYQTIGTQSPPCSLELPLNGAVVYHNAGSSLSPLSMDMWCTCEPRSWVYVLVFGLVPLCVGLVISLLLWKFCKDERSSEESALTEFDEEKY